MLTRDHLMEARRWAKFPATVLLATGVLWLLQSIFDLDHTAIKQQSETLVGAVSVFTQLVLVTLGSMVVGICLLFLQRWAIWAAYLLPALALLYTTADKVETISRKFAESNRGVDGSFGDGVMTALLLLALWGLYLLVVFYLRKVQQHMQQGARWVGGKLAPRNTELAGVGGVPESLAQPGNASDDFCLLLPDTPEEVAD